MKLIEAEAKDILERHGLAVPSNRTLVRPGDAIARRPSGAVVKAQVTRGGRGKAGLVRVSDGDVDDDVSTIFAKLRQNGDQPLALVEDRSTIAAEYYVAWVIDDVLQCPVLMISPRGGVDIEANSQLVTRVPVVVRANVEPYELVQGLIEAGFEGRVVGAVARFAAQLYRVFVGEDALLLEINPLVLTEAGALLALDCKMVLDGYAAGRHRGLDALHSAALHHAGMTELEAEATRNGFTFVEMAGDVAIISGGAGLGMALVDMFGEAGHPAANFCDLLGGSDDSAFRAMVSAVLKRAERPDVKVIAAYFTLSATSLKAAAMGLLAAMDAAPPRKPLVVGFGASTAAQTEMTLEECRVEFGKRGYVLVDDPAALVEASISLIAKD